MPPGWQDGARSPDTAGATDCIPHLTALLSAVGTYIPRAVLVGDQASQVGHGTFRFGTLLFADVSGFSTLTERFSQERGREGAEEITLIINRFLEAVNGIAVRYGGDLLKFAGDAAISFYQGPEHAARACRAAHEMQQAVQERFACVETSLGTFPLRMSIGLGTGEVFAISLGTPGNAEYAVMGQALGAVGHAEQLAHAGQVFVDHATRELAGSTTTTVPASESGFCQLVDARPRASAQESPDLRLSPPELPPVETLTWLLARLDALLPYLPHGLLEKLVPSPRQVAVESDHRWVTTAFADLRGANSLVQALGAERQALLTEIVNRYFLAMRQVVERYEGVLHKVGVGPTGPHLFITFGAPKSHPDDPERAVRAALDMQQALVDVNHNVDPLVGDMAGVRRPLFRQAVGITTGFVFAASLGASRRWEYTVMGDLVNLAARLTAKAADGEILVNDATIRYLGERFAVRPRPPIQVKGKHEFVLYAQVTGLSSLPPLLSKSEGHLVGREAELSTAGRLLERASHAEGSLLSVRGEAGMGKTRLAQEIAQQAQRRGLRVAAGTCLSYGSSIPYLPWADVLRGLLEIPAGDRQAQLKRLTHALNSARLTGWEPLIAEVLDLESEETELTASLDPRLRQQRLFDIVLDLIQVHAHRRPTLLVFEDAHWADPTSLELLDYVGRNIASSPVMILVLHRPQEGLDGRWQQLDHATRTDLHELPARDVQRLIADLLKTETVPDQLVGLVLRKAQGNPLYTEEVVRALIDAGVLQQEQQWALVADPEQAGVPDTIHGIIQSRIDRLEETDRRVLQVASVIGRVFSGAVLAGAYPYDDLTDTLPRRIGRLGTLGMVHLETPEPEPIYMFRHALTQDVAYESLSYARRREVHRRVGTFVEARGEEATHERPGFLAHHFFQGHAWREALTYSLVAGRKAQREYANKAAVAHFERTLQAAAEVAEPCEEEQIEALETLGTVLSIVGRYDDALKHLQMAQGLVGERAPSAGRNRRTADLYAKASEILRAMGDYESAMEWLDRGLALPGVPGTHEGVSLYLMGAAIFYQQGENHRAREWCLRGLDGAEKLEGASRQEVLARGSYLLGAILTRRGDYDEAAEHCQASIALYAQMGNLLGQAEAYNNLAFAYDAQGAWQQAVHYYRAANEIAERIGYAEGQARTASNLGEIYLMRGELDAAKEQYRQALDIVERLGHPYGVALLHNNLGAAHARGGEWEDARQYLERSLALFREIGSEEFLAEVYRHLAEVALGQGAAEQALDHVRRSLDYAQAHQMGLEESPAHRIRGQIRLLQGDLDQAEDCLQQALSLATRAENRYEMARARLELARVQVQRHRHKAARDLARQATQDLQALGAQLDLEEAEALLRQLEPST